MHPRPPTNSRPREQYMDQLRQGGAPTSIRLLIGEVHGHPDIGARQYLAGAASTPCNGLSLLSTPTPSLATNAAQRTSPDRVPTWYLNFRSSCPERL